jgi:hypothetical protein
MSAININLIIEQGADYNVDFTIRNDDGSRLNLTDYSVSSFLKKHPTSIKTYPFNVSFTNRLAGEIKVSMDSTITNTLSEGRYVYDVLLTSGNGTKTRVIQGNILVSPGVTS